MAFFWESLHFLLHCDDCDANLASAEFEADAGNSASSKHKRLVDAYALSPSSVGN
jgi:hypothetical protein